VRRGVRRAALVAWLAAATLGAFAPSARAAPETADEHVREALAKGPYPFCQHPTTPLPSHARDLCALAEEIPDCAGFVQACGADKHDDSKRDWAWLRELLARLGQIVLWVLVAAIVAALAVPIVRALLRARRNERAADPAADAPAPAAPEAPSEPPEFVTDAERLVDRADALVRQGQLDRAVFVLLEASLRALDERGAIRLERHTTHGEYVRACREDAARRPLGDLVRVVDRIKFGHEVPDGAAVARARERAVAVVRMLPLALFALVAPVLLVGCGEAQRYVQGADPAGDGLLVDLLARQGANVGRLGTSLATLPMPKTGDEPIVIVDAERVPLEDDARAHLAKWVDAGGVLVLAGAPKTWPKELDARAAPTASRVAHVRARSRAATDTPAADAHLARRAALDWATRDVELAELEDGKLYAAVRVLGRGRVLGVANDDLFTNAGLARPGNARALIDLLDALGGTSFRVARPEDAILPPSNPLASLLEAGLGMGLAHALVATLLLFAAVGIRHARPRPAPPPRRRAFAEHVEATGALYARTGIAAHALATYARYAEGLLRAAMPRGTTDPASFLASRTGADRATCAALWARATAATSLPAAPARGDELAVLRELSALVSAATHR
jgi:hypothetical protein